MKRLTPLLAVLALAGCGGSPHVRTVRLAPVPQRVTVCSGLTDSCHTVALGLRGTSRPPAGCKVPDVSSFQGHPDWASVRSWQLAQHCPGAGIFKLGEFVQDPDAAFNAGSLHRLGMLAIGYWFVRPTGCQHEASQIIAEAHALGVRLAVLDDEVPGVAGYATCLAAPLRRAGFVVALYTSPGSWGGGPSGGLPTWEATFGPVLGCLPWTCHPVAWQYTDGAFGAVTFVPGIGLGDVSADRGLLALASPPKRKPSRAQIRRWTGALHASERQYRYRSCGVLSQRISWFSHRLKGPKRAHRLGALKASRRAYARRSCAVFAKRVRYFERRLRG